MPNSIVFPYGITLKENGEISTIPVAEIAFLNKEGDWLSLFFIIDSGATISALPKSDALIFGIDVEMGKLMTVSGIGGEKVYGWQHRISARLGNKIINFPIVFLDKDGAPRVLGRAEIFERFVLIFDEKFRRSGFIDDIQQQAQTIRKILDKIK